MSHRFRPGDYTFFINPSFYFPSLTIWSCLCFSLISPISLLQFPDYFFICFLFLSISSLSNFLLPGEVTCKHIFKIPLCNLVGRSIERPLKSPLVNKVLTAPTPAMAPPTPLISATHSLSLSRMEIKEIASRTRKELLGRKGNHHNPL